MRRARRMEPGWPWAHAAAWTQAGRWKPRAWNAPRHSTDLGHSNRDEPDVIMTKIREM
jgi:hypothetical protein